MALADEVVGVLLEAEGRVEQHGAGTGAGPSARTRRRWILTIVGAVSPEPMIASRRARLRSSSARLVQRPQQDGGDARRAAARGCRGRRRTPVDAWPGAAPAGRVDRRRLGRRSRASSRVGRQEQHGHARSAAKRSRGRAPTARAARDRCRSRVSQGATVPSGRRPRSWRAYPRCRSRASRDGTARSASLDVESRRAGEPGRSERMRRSPPSGGTGRRSMVPPSTARDRPDGRRVTRAAAPRRRCRPRTGRRPRAAPSRCASMSSARRRPPWRRRSHHPACPSGRGRGGRRRRRGGPWRASSRRRRPKAGRSRPARGPARRGRGRRVIRGRAF